jgi:hypothetical protein
MSGGRFRVVWRVLGPTFVDGVLGGRFTNGSAHFGIHSGHGTANLAPTLAEFSRHLRQLVAARRGKHQRVSFPPPVFSGGLAKIPVKTGG